jgi:DNA-directed RNA polymerase subunit M/transcription elongation factor TFIIS
MSGLQDLINIKLKEIPMSAFIQTVMSNLVKNTFNILCPRCGSDEVNEQFRQTRSADEATTKFYTCLRCGKKWKKG